MPIQLGDRVRDRMTGCEGIVIGITEWLYNCRRPIVQPIELKDGKPQDTLAFDEPQVDVIEAGAFQPLTLSVQPAPAKTGGPRDTPQRRPDPQR